MDDAFDYDEDPGTCPDCGRPWEIVRPGKSQPTCDCNDYCPIHRQTKCEYVMPPPHYEGGGIWGWICPECHPESYTAAGIDRPVSDTSSRNPSGADTPGQQ